MLEYGKIEFCLSNLGPGRAEIIVSDKNQKFF